MFLFGGRAEHDAHMTIQTPCLMGTSYISSGGCLTHLVCGCLMHLVSRLLGTSRLRLLDTSRLTVA